MSNFSGVPVSAQYSVIVADPPWQYRDKSKNRGGAARHYSTLSLDELKQVNVNDYAAKDAMLLMWCTGPQLKDGLALLEAWGFQYRTMGFYWVKRTTKYWDNFALMLRKWLVDIPFSRYREMITGEAIARLGADKWYMGMGSYTRANAEFVLLGVKGKRINRHSASVNCIIEAAVGQHSEKPEIFYEKLVELVGENTQVMELFARTSRPNFHALGDQMDNNDPFFVLDEKFKIHSTSNLLKR